MKICRYINICPNRNFSFFRMNGRLKVNILEVYMYVYQKSVKGNFSSSKYCPIERKIGILISSDNIPGIDLDKSQYSKF